MGKDFGFESAIFTNSRTVGKNRRRLFGVGEITIEKIEALEKVGKFLPLGEQEAAKELINERYPFRHMEATGRAYSEGLITLYAGGISVSLSLENGRVL